MTAFLLHMYRYCEVYMLGSIFFILIFLGFYFLIQLKKFPHLVVEIRNEENHDGHS